MKLADNVELIAILNGKNSFAHYVREICAERKFDCIAIDLPPFLQEEVSQAVDELPQISAVTTYNRLNRDEDFLYYIPIDPCDGYIEAIRQAKQRRTPLYFVGNDELEEPELLPPLPDSYALNKLGYEEYTILVSSVLASSPEEDDEYRENSAQIVVNTINQLSEQFSNILVITHYRAYLSVINTYRKDSKEVYTPSALPIYETKTFFINPDHLYFALGELPFITGRVEKERHEIFTEPVDIVDTIKDLFRDTRDSMYDNKDDALHLSPVRLQAALQFLRNLTVLDCMFIPNIFDIIIAAKGIGGNAFGVKVLKNVRYYPYLPFENSEQLLSIGINQVQLPNEPSPFESVNLFQNSHVEWRKIPLKPDSSELQKKKYRYQWNPSGFCSHLPEDHRIESFNTTVRHRSLSMLTEDHFRSEKFQTSVKDGIDLRETIRNWHTGNIYVKEIPPPPKGNVDTVVIIFDEDHDERYTQQTTWYAEHDEESTLTFYGTDPFSNLIGPGVGKCVYGGLSLLFPPRNIPCAFQLTKNLGFSKLSHRLLFGALLHSKEKYIAYVSAKKPDLKAKSMAAQRHKKLIWVPLSSFSSETMRKLRVFHVLNGHHVRSWATKFIGD